VGVPVEVVSVNDAPTGRKMDVGGGLTVWPVEFGYVIVKEMPVEPL